MSPSAARDSWPRRRAARRPVVEGAGRSGGEVIGLLLLREGGVGGEHDDGAVGAQERLAGGLGVVPEDGAEPRRVDEGAPGRRISAGTRTSTRATLRSFPGLPSSVTKSASRSSPTSSIVPSRR